MQYRANTVICLFSSVFLFLVAPCLWAANLSGATFHRYRAEINRNVQQWKNSLKQYDSILENYEATSPKAKEQEKKVQSYYTKMRESCSNYYEHCANTYKKQLAEGVKKGAPMVQDLEKEIEILKVLGGKLKKTLTIEKQHDLLTWFNVYNSPFEILPQFHFKTAGERMVKIINGTEFAFCWCPPGEFTMGSEKSEVGHYERELLHKVSFAQGFWMLETPVTQKQWKVIMHSNPSNFKGDTLPVEMVTWNECKDFCNKCKLLGLPVQLPSEAQWEYACRGGTSSPHAGSIDNMGWYKNNSNSRTQPVKSKQPNSFGLYDMHGNVWEWCADFWQWDNTSNMAGQAIIEGNSTDRVMRGGSWGDIANFCRSAFRQSCPFNSKKNNVGFRVVINPQE